MESGCNVRAKLLCGVHVLLKYTMDVEIVEYIYAYIYLYIMHTSYNL